MGLANVSSRHGELVDTKYGKRPVGSLSSYQLSHTESNFDVAINIDSVARRDNHIQGIESLASLRNIRERVMNMTSIMRKKIWSGNYNWMKMT